MSYNISKELFEAVMNIKINKLQVDEFNYIWINIDSTHLSRFDSINNFFFRCKKWAKSNGYRLLSGSQSNLMLCEESHHCDAHKSTIMWDDKYESFGGKSEQQAVFDACQWIIDNKGK
jgi:hypothetical protein